jgi:thiamine pyrophosphate-dependent acetolactate synthase large subunit-like protein
MRRDRLRHSLPLPIVEAFRIASIGLPGPVLVDVPKDILHMKGLAFVSP